MKYCNHCGKEIDEKAVVCVHCGCAVGGVNPVEDVPSTGLNVLGFLFPLVGLILYLVNMEKAPKKAAAIGKCSLIGFVISIVCSSLLFL